MATGYYHQFNVLKFRILDTLSLSKKPMTSREIGDALGIPYQKISDALCHYRKVGIPYFSRLPKKAANGAYRWKITESGKQAWAEYILRIKFGLPLNRLQLPQEVVEKEISKILLKGHINIKALTDTEILPNQLKPYLKLNGIGVLRLGLTEDDILSAAGLVEKAA